MFILAHISNLSKLFSSYLETALGVRLDERLDGDEYRKHITKVEEMLLERLKNPLNVFQFIYNNFSEGKTYLKAMEKLHEFSSGIIEKRRELLGDELLKKGDSGEKDSEAKYNWVSH